MNDLFERNVLDTDVKFVKGVGPNVATLFAKLGVNTIGDLLYHLPRRYEDRSKLPDIGSVRPGQHVTVRGRIDDVQARPVSGGRVVIKATLVQGRHGIHLVWFNQPWIKRKLEAYRGEMIAYGLVKEGSSYYEIASPEFELLDEDSDGGDFAKITPVYPLTEGLSQTNVRRAVSRALDMALESVPEILPQSLRRHAELPEIQWALQQIHRPESDEDRQEARRRLVYEEFFVMQCVLAMQRAQSKAEEGIGFNLGLNEDGSGAKALWEEVHKMLPFTLTNAQSRVIKEIWHDMQDSEPMNRLVQGDVGSGKTAIAAAALLACVRCGYQGALMAPTEILAEQHGANLKRLFEPLGLEVAMIIGKQNSRDRKKAMSLVESGLAQIAVGTHALIQEGIAFQNLGLAVVDEQHRFGVLQRAALKAKGVGNPDVLVMTATPIPRSLTMTVHGTLDLSVIDELPPGRSPIKTRWMRTSDRASVYKGVRDLIAQGRQAYVVCPMVMESEKMQTQAAEETYRRLSEFVFPDLRVGLLHGQMKPKEKEDVMDAFRLHELDILVATTVIEVGVDVPNASVMVIEDANRFGLSQLHQLRGRVGRGEHQSFCILIADAKSAEATARLDTMTMTTDGFKIAEVDLRLRGPGELLGTRQSGNLDYKIADLIQDSKLLEESRQAAAKLIKFDPGLDRPEYRLLRERVDRKNVEHARIAEA